MSGISAVQDGIEGIPLTWDWKDSYIERLAKSDGMELFSEGSVTADTMLLLAAPPVMPIKGFSGHLSPIGLVTDVNFTSQNSLRPMWEIGTDKTYFTRGKTSYQLSIGAMVANKPSLMKLLSRESPIQVDTSDGYPDGTKESGQFWMNLDSEYTAVPFGILMLFKSKGSSTGDLNGDMISAAFLQNCNISSLSFAMNSQSITLQENITIMFDKMITVDYDSHTDI